MWIEITLFCCPDRRYVVTPRAGVWIEIIRHGIDRAAYWSLPVRECGLKLITNIIYAIFINVTPRAGVWIEINICCSLLAYSASLPVRECGLKF